ncbi:MAG: methionyl-tRNA formyltransferase, partial [Patescibacteria group bacterium]
MRVIFFGTPDYVLPIVNSLSGIVAVVTQPPKPSGREKMIIRSPIDNWAFKHQIPVFYDALEAISKVNPGLGILAAYGKIIPEPVINFFPKGILNVHPSLLPKFRGASPIQAAIVSGEKETGATIIKLDSQIDHGPV